MPSEVDMIPKNLKNKELASLLSTAMKALTVAENVIAKQADAILESTHEFGSYLHEKRISNSLPNQQIASTPIHAVAEVLPILNVEINSSIESEPIDSSSTPTSCGSAAKTASTMTTGNRSTVSDDAFRVVESRTRRKRRRTTKVATGCKRGVVLGSCYRKMDVFLSRMGPEVSAEQVQDFCKGLLDDWCEVEMLKSKFPALYSSFRITCYTHHNEKILDPNNWETGALIRPFYRKVSNL